MNIKPKVVYTAVGVCFALVGILTLLNVAAQWNDAHHFLWLAFAYGLLNLTVSYGFITKERWLMPALLLNLLGNVGLIVLRYSYGGNFSFYTILTLVVGIVLLWYVYKTKKLLKDTSLGRVIGVLFLGAWIISIYTMGTIV